MPELQRNATRKALNEEMHTLLGNDLYAKYVALHRKQAQNYHNMKKETVAPKRKPAVEAGKPIASVAGSAPSSPSSPKKKKSPSSSGKPKSSSKAKGTPGTAAS
mgnify:CR=1 FL=1